MTKIVTVAQMVAIEKAADAAGHSYAAMMELAGGAVAARILAREGARRVLVLVGRGNNGGDGLVAGRIVRECRPDADVTCYLLTPRDDTVFQGALAAGVAMVAQQDDADFMRLQALVMGADVLVDGLFGTGIRLPLRDDAAALLQAVHAALGRLAQPPAIITPTGDPAAAPTPPARPTIIAVDCPSGLDCDTGEIDPHALPADETVTFAAAKPGQLVFPGAALCGRLLVAAIGIPPGTPELDDIALELLDPPTLQAVLPTRRADSHKGSHGKALVVAGSHQYIGAAALAGGACARVGAGLVRIAAPAEIIPALAPQVPEAVWTPLPAANALETLRGDLTGQDALLLGCGWGDSPATRELLEGVLAQPDLPPLVIDADGLNILARLPAWWQRLPPQTILTPHPREFARLAGLESAGVVQAARWSLAREKAAAWGVVVVLKGAFTVIAAPDGKTVISPFASGKLATAGTGDVLAGAIAGLLAQGLAPLDAAAAGVWLHGWAGQFGTPAHGVVAPDVLAGLGAALESAAAQQFRAPRG